jgi:C1A family cysteine protease
MGWLRQPPDFRDYKYGPPSATLEVLPEQVDLRREMPKVFDQGHLGSCAANSAAACIQHCEKKAKDPDYDRLSRLWIYWYAREKIGTTNEDSGSYIRDCFKIASERGVPRERYWPYEIGTYREEPTAGERSAPHHRVLEYRAVDERSERDMQACVAEGYPFAFGFAVYGSFWDIGDDGKWLGTPGTIDGYHAVVCVGYDFRSSAWAGGFWIVRNSWGSLFGAGGHFFVPRGFMGAEAWDLWTVRKVTVDPL